MEAVLKGSQIKKAFNFRHVVTSEIIFTNHTKGTRVHIIPVNKTVRNGGNTLYRVIIDKIIGDKDET